MIFKAGVDGRWLCTAAWWGAHRADQLHQELATGQAVITSTGEGRHRATRSLHYAGGYLGESRAFDMRIWTIPETHRREFVTRLQAELGTDYQVILEDTHIHVEWQPIYRETTNP